MSEPTAGGKTEADESTGNNEKYKRRFKNLLINPAYQMKFIFWLTILGLLLVVFFNSVFHFYIKANFQTFVKLATVPPEIQLDAVRQMNHMGIMLTLWSLLFTVMVAILGLFFSHRTAGPMFQVLRVCKEIAAGDTKRRVMLRKEDDFKEVAIAFNQMMDELEPRLKK